MSKSQQLQIQCPECGAKGYFTIWESVNTKLDPELKQKVISGDLFKWTCPLCGKSFDVKYPMLYHDMVGKKLIEFRPPEPGQQRDTSENPMYQMFIIQGYTVQYAYTLQELSQKITGGSNPSTPIPTQGTNPSKNYESHNDTANHIAKKWKR